MKKKRVEDGYFDPKQQILSEHTQYCLGHVKQKAGVMEGIHGVV